MWVKVIIVNSLLVGFALSDNQSNCDISDLGTDEWKFSLKKNITDNVKAGDNLFASTYKGKIENLSSTCSCGISKCPNDYLNFSTKNMHFYMTFTEGMNNFDEDMININCQGNVVYSLFMTCQNEEQSNLLLRLQVSDYNEHPPEIAHGNTTYKVPSPLMPMGNIIIYGDKISATDKDFSNTAIDFKISPDDFDVVITVDTSTKPETFYPTFRAKRVMRLKEDEPKKYTITATDNGKDPGPLTSEPLEIFIVMDKDTSLDIPVFVYPEGSSSYSFQYKDDILTVLKGPISVNTAKPTEAVDSLQLSGDLSEHFTAKYNSATSEVELTVKSKIENPTSSYVVLTLGLTTDTFVTTPILIYFSNAPVDTGPKFSQHVYIGNYDESKNEVILKEEIKVATTSTDPLKVNITGDLSDKFEVKYDKDKNIYTVNVITDLTPAEIISQEYLYLTLEASDDSESDTSGLIITLPTHTLEFTSVMYAATYTEDDTVSVDETQPIDFKSKVSDASVRVEDKYSKYFNVTYKDKKYNLDVQAALPKDILTSYTEIAVIITATDKYDNIANAVIKIALPSTDGTEPLKFSDPYYTIQYKEGQTDGLIDFDKPVSFDKTVNMNDVSILLSDYKENFELVFYQSKKWKINITNALNSDIFDKRSEIVTTMEATEKGVSGKGLCVLVIELVGSKTDNPPEFNEPYYVVQYKKQQTGYIDFDPAVAFKNYNNFSKISIELATYSENFEVVLQSNKWRIKINKPLDADTYARTNEIVTTMEANETDIAEKGVAVLVIELIDDSSSDTLEFEEPFYIVQYKKNQIGYIDFNPPIAFKNVEDVSKISMIGLTTYSENFEVVLESNKWRIHIKNPLDADTYPRTNEIVTTMEANETDIAEKGVAVLVIELTDDSNSDDIPEFIEPYYIVEFKPNQTGNIDFNTAVSFKNVKNLSEISINLTEYTDNFQVVRDSDGWKLKILTPLSDKDFTENSELITIMEATEKNVTGSGSTVLVIRLIESETKVPKFKEAYYTADYPKSGSGSFVFANDLDFEYVDELGKVNVTVDEYASNFKIEYIATKKLWQITILSGLDPSLLDSNAYITATLTAKIKDSTYSPKAAFVLSLPEKEAEEAPVFTKSYYKANYAINGDTSVVTFDDDIGFTNKNNMNKIIIKSDEFSSYFTFKYDSNNWHLISEGILQADLLNRTDLVVSVTATDSSNKLEGHSVIDLKLPSVNTEGAPKFSQTYYTGHYEITGDKSIVTFDENIGFSNKADMTNIKITTDKYIDNFNFSYSDGKWSVDVTKNLDQSTLNSKIDIVMALIATENSKTDEIGQSALLLTLPTVNDDGAPKFSKIAYESTYDSKTTILVDDIQIVGKTDLNKINVTLLEDQYKSNFQIVFNSTAKSWSVIVNSIPGGLTQNKNDLVLTLIATEANKTGEAALIINFPVLSTPKFSKDQYYGNYTLGDSPYLEIEDFSIVNKDDQSDLKLSFISTDGDFSNNFNVTYNKKNNIWTMSLKTAIDDAKLINKTTIILSLTATEEENDNQGKSTLIIYLINNNEGADIGFTQVHYTGSYESNVDTTIVKLDKNIQITSDKDISTAVVKVESDDDFDAPKYFNLTKNSDYYEVTVVQPLSPEILQKQKSLVMTLEADLDGNKNYATLVVELPIQESAKAVKFENPLYNGEYKVTADADATVTFTVDTAVIVSDEDAANIHVFISEDSIYGKYFDINKTKTSVELVTKAALPKEIYTKETVLPIILVASIIGSTTKASTVVDIKINYDSYLGSVQFENLLYNGKYEIKKQVVTVTVDTIKLITDKPDEIDVYVTNVYKTYFEAKYSKTSSELTITKILNIPDSILKDISTVSILLSASIKNTKVTSNSVVNLRIINDDTPDPDVAGTIAFDTVSNTAEYSIENNKGNLKNDKDIGVTTDRSAEEIETNITDDLGLSTYFNSSCSGQKFSVNLVKDLPEDVFLSNSYISLTLVAKIKNTGEKASAVLTIRFDNDQDGDTGHIAFKSIVYNGVYEIDKDIASINDIDNIVVDTDAEDTNVSLTILNDMDKFFKASYFNKVVTLDVSTTAASAVLRSQNNIAVVLQANIKNTLITTETVVNLKVKDNDANPGPDNSTIAFPKLIYNAEYLLDKDNSVKFTVDDITLETSRTENEIEVTIENDLGYQKYFTALYAHNHISITLKENLPDSLFDEEYTLTLSVKASVKKADKINSQAVLNIKLRDENKTGLIGTSGNNKPYIIAVSFLSVFILLLIIAAILFYYFRLRKSSYEKMTEEEYMNRNSKVRFDKTPSRQSGDTLRHSSAIENRRPTGFIFNPHPTEENEPRESYTDSEEPNRERKKSVAFDDNIEKLQIEAPTDDDDVDKATKDVEE